MNVTEIVSNMRVDDPTLLETAAEIQEQLIERVEWFQGFIVEKPSGGALIPFDRSPRVYFLMQGDYVAYVGQTVGLPGRINWHINDGKEFDEVAYIDIERREDLLIIEGLNIIEHSPELNIAKPSMNEVIKMIASSMTFC